MGLSCTALLGEVWDACEVVGVPSTLSPSQDGARLVHAGTSLSS